MRDIATLSEAFMSGVGVVPEVAHVLRSLYIFILTPMSQLTRLLKRGTNLENAESSSKIDMDPCFSLIMQQGQALLLCGANSGPTTGQAILVSQ